MELDNLAELASLYALGALDEEEQSWVDAHANQYPDLEGEISQYQDVISWVPYSAALMPLSGNLKERLFEKIAGESMSPSDIDPSMADPSMADLVEQSKTVEWESYAPTPGTLVGKLLVDLEKREIHCFVRSWGKAAFPNHCHLADEEIIVLEGDLLIGDRLYQPGERIRSSVGTVHQPKTLSGCLLFLRASLDDELLP